MAEPNLFDNSGTGLAPPDGYVMRKPCGRCAATSGTIRPSGGQDCVFCNNCNAFQYNAPKTETGRPIRSVASRPDIKSSQRARIFERDNHSCVGCGAQPSPTVQLCIGHIISVKQGLGIGIAESDLYDDYNLMSLCEECNLGQGERSFSARLIWKLWWAQVIQRTERPAG